MFCTQLLDGIYSLCQGKFKFGLLNCVRFNRDFVVPRLGILGFCSIHFIVALAGLKNIVRYTGDIVKKADIRYIGVSLGGGVFLMSE